MLGRECSVLLQRRVHPGDRVCICMTRKPELIYAMLACSRIGAANKHTSASTQPTTPRAPRVAGTRMYSTGRETGWQRRRSKPHSSSPKPAVVGFPPGIKGKGIYAQVGVNNKFETASGKDLIGALSKCDWPSVPSERLT